jgi:acyl carrier protein
MPLVELIVTTAVPDDVTEATKTRADGGLDSI